MMAAWEDSVTQLLLNKCIKSLETFDKKTQQFISDIRKNNKKIILKLRLKIF